MTNNELLATCRQAGILVRADGDSLEIDAPRGALTPELRDLLAHRKRELLALLNDGVAERRDVFEGQLAATPAPRVPMFLFRADVAYVRGVCFSCGDALPALRFGRCWRCALAWRLACRLPVPAALAAALDTARRVS